MVGRLVRTRQPLAAELTLAADAGRRTCCGWTCGLRNTATWDPGESTRDRGGPAVAG